MRQSLKHKSYNAWTPILKRPVWQVALAVSILYLLSVLLLVNPTNGVAPESLHLRRPAVEANDPKNGRHPTVGTNASDGIGFEIAKTRPRTGEP